MHRLFGWLQVGEALQIGDDVETARKRFPRLRRHPHLWGWWDESNTVYAATEELRFEGAPEGTAGAGLFEPDPERRLVLTAPDARLRTEWRLPAAFKPADAHPGLSYHRDPKRWTENDGKTPGPGGGAGPGVRARRDRTGGSRGMGGWPVATKEAQRWLRNGATRRCGT